MTENSDRLNNLKNSFSKIELILSLLSGISLRSVPGRTVDFRWRRQLTWDDSETPVMAPPPLPSMAGFLTDGSAIRHRWQLSNRQPCYPVSAIGLWDIFATRCGVFEIWALPPAQIGVGVFDIKNSISREGNFEWSSTASRGRGGHLRRGSVLRSRKEWVYISGLGGGASHRVGTILSTGNSRWGLDAGQHFEKHHSRMLRYIRWVFKHELGIVGMGYRPLDRAIWVALTLLVLGLCYLRQPCVIG